MLVGLTGGIGSGKTTVSNAFAQLNVPIIDTDIIARNVLQSQPQLLERLSATFGSKNIQDNGKLDREALRKIAFSNNENKLKLDNIMHPAIRLETLAEIDKHSKAIYCIVVVPLLIETNFKELVDRVLVVSAPEQRRLGWLKQRSNLTTKEAKAIINSQTSDEERLRYADDYIINDKEIDDLKKHVYDLHATYLDIATTKNDIKS